MICKGIKLTPTIGPGGEIDGWECTDIDVDVGDDCEDCCDRPDVDQMLGGQFPELSCPDGCHLHTRGDPAAGETVEAWCCKD